MGMFGAVVSRAEAQVTRIAMIFALSDGSATITHKHLEAAFAYWDYASDARSSSSATNCLISRRRRSSKRCASAPRRG